MIGRRGLTALWNICCLAPFLEKTFFTTRPESFFSATATAASTTSRDVGSVEVDALVDAAVDDGWESRESGGCGRGVGNEGKFGDGGGAIER